MRVDGREIPVSGDLLQPLTRRTADILRVVLASLFVATVVAGSLITRSQWDALEASVSNIVGVLSPDLSNLVYVLYGIAILALPFGILIGLIAGRRWRLLAGYAAAALLAGITLSITRNGLKAPNLDIEMSSRLDSIPSQLLDDPRWIGALAAVLTVSGPWLPARWRRAWWSLLLLFVPIHLVVSTVVPARSLLGLGTGWLIGAILVLLFGTPALAVPLDAAVRELQANDKLNVLGITVLSPAGLGPLVLSAHCNRGPSARKIGDNDTEDVIVELYGQNQRSRGALRQFWRWLSFRSSETAPLHASLRRAVEHRALMDIALTELGLASSTLVALSTLERQWEMFAHTAPRGRLFKEVDDPDVLSKVWASLLELHARQIAHGDLRFSEIRIHDGRAVFGGYAYAELGASKAQVRNDNAQLMLISAAQFGHKQAVHDALRALGQEPVVAAAGRLTRTAQPKRIRSSVPHANELMAAVREEVGKQSSADKIRAEQVTRFSRNQIIQLVLLIALVYVAYPFVSQVPTFVTELRDVHWGWASLGLVISGLTYVGAAAALWACADGLVKFGNTVVMQVANTFAATTTPAGVGGLALSVRFLQKGGLGTLRATAAVALQQVMQVVTHVSLLVAFSIVAGTNTEITNFVPKGTILYLIGGIALGAIGAYTFVPQLRIWLRDEVRPQVAEVLTELAELAKDPRRFALIVGGCAATTLGAALALWASIEAFGGGTTFVTVTVVTMIGGTLASAAPTPGGVGAVEAALIGGLAAFGLPAAIAVPSVLLYRVLTCWLPVFLGWPILRSMTRKEMV